MIELNKNNKKIFWLTFTITTSCNLRCNYCSAKDILDNNKLDNFEVRSQFIKELKRLKEVYPDYIINLNIYGGEPLLATDLVEFLKECKLYADYIDIFSNFSIKFSDKLSDSLHFAFKNNIIENIMVSIHSSANEELLKNNILKFKKNIIATLLINQLSENDIDKKYKWVEWFKENDIKYEYSTIRESTKTPDICHSSNDKIKEIIKDSENSNILLLQVDDKFVKHSEYELSGFKQAPKFYLVRCHLTLYRITFDGYIETFCAANPKVFKPLSEGIEPIDIVCSNNYGGCQCGIELNKLLIKKK